tara:strand:+ start:606 stop:887 length:282 start_codon:yes stop_codon:yes gene_type:complete
MNITITQLEREATTGIITTIHWSASKTSGDHTASSYGSVGLTAGDTIIPFANVTEANVLAWLNSAIDFEATEVSLDTQLEALATPVSLTGMPW